MKEFRDRGRMLKVRLFAPNQTGKFSSHKLNKNGIVFCAVMQLIHLFKGENFQNRIKIIN